MPKSTKKKPGTKRAKPHPDFPLWLHPSGRWCKKIRQRVHYFGKTDDPQGAVERYLAVKHDLLAGRTPRTEPDGLKLRELLNRFLAAKELLRDNGEITSHTFSEYRKTCERIGEAFSFDRLVDDLATDDFRRLRSSMARQWGPVRLGNEIQRVRGVFKFGYDEGLIDKPARYGQSFKKPSRKTIRQTRAAKPEKILKADEIRTILDVAGQPMHAMVLLAVNMGFGNNDIATLSRKVIDFNTGWIRRPRPKTGIVRRAPMWPETVISLRAAMAARPEPKDSDDDNLVFITKYGSSWARRNESCPVSKGFKKLLVALKITRKGVGFYTLRQVFATIGADTPQQAAQVTTDFLMGHVPADSDRSAVYRQRISNERLQAVVDHVRKWLIPDGEGT